MLITNDIQSNKLTTVNATITQIVNFTMTGDPSSGVARARVFAKKQGTDDTHQWSLSAGFHKDSGGVLHLTGAIVNMLDQESGLGALGWTATFVNDGSDNLALQVKGAASTSVDWGCYAEAEWLFQ